jgi:integrase
VAVTSSQIKVEDIAENGYTADRATVRQKKTRRPVRFELSEQTRQAVDDYLKAANKRPGEFLFTSRRGPDRSMTTRQESTYQSPFMVEDDAFARQRLSETRTAASDNQLSKIMCGVSI